MRYVIGVDEAGYGPNLGPLVITATVWQIPESCQLGDFAARVRPFISSPGEYPVAPLVIGDSKALYTSGGSLGPLERVVLGASLSLGLPCGTWQRLWSGLALREPTVDGAREFPNAFDEQPWHERFDLELPLASDPHDVVAAVESWHSTVDATGLRLTAIKSMVVFPSTWNGLLDRTRSKGTALSQLTFELVAYCLRNYAPDRPVWVCCDKHGGRSRYGPMLQEMLPENLVEVHKEQRSESIYRTGPRDARIEFRFTAKGDRSVPSGLASMVSKYLRELAMKAFNAYWQRHLPELKPTAGYPADARRFRREIHDAQRRLGIRDDLLWRKR